MSRIDNDSAPYEGGPWAIGGLAWLWAKRGAIVIALAFLAGYLVDRIGGQ